MSSIITIGKWETRAIILSVQLCICYRVSQHSCSKYYCWMIATATEGSLLSPDHFLLQFCPLFFTWSTLGEKTRRVGLALLISCSALDISNVSPRVDEHVFQKAFLLDIGIPSLVTTSYLLQMLVCWGLPPLSTLIVAVILDIYFRVLFSWRAYFYQHINGKLLKRIMR